ncbi:MAG: hypothetical protein ACP5JK_01955 [Candidatus Aenigmatarchaeota archaeon]
MAKYKYIPKEVRMKITKKRIIIFSIAAILLTLLYVSFPYIQEWYKSSQPLTEINYFGVPMKFREDIRLAKNIPVYPNDDYIKSIFRNKDLKGITISILNTTNQTNIIGVEAVEITFKLSTFYNLAGLPIAIKGKEVSSFFQIQGNKTNPVIVIIPPIAANETVVRAENYTVIISGKNLKDLDLATIKFITIVLGI